MKPDDVVDDVELDEVADVLVVEPVAVWPTDPLIEATVPATGARRTVSSSAVRAWSTVT